MLHLPSAALGFALAELDHAVREDGWNDGPRVRQYLTNVSPPINVTAPWCAAFVQYCSDMPARQVGVANPLDEVKLEALVQSYVNWAREGSRIVDTPAPGDLAAFRFGGSDRWNHIGFVIHPPDPDGVLWTVEGNTGGADQREGEGVWRKARRLLKQPTCFIRWG